MGEIKLRHQDAYDRLKNTLTIDVTELDTELVSLPINQMEAAEYTCLASNRSEEAKHDLEIRVAEFSQELRLQVDSKGKELSETRIKSQVVLFPEVQKTQTAYDEANYEYELWKALSGSIRTKTESIKKICDLIMAGYTTPDQIRRSENAKERAKRKAT